LLLKKRAAYPHCPAMRLDSLYCAVSVVASLLLQGCTALTMQRPVTDAESKFEFNIPAVWKSAAEGTQGRISTGWLRTFRDSEMDGLVDEALKRNQNLRIAAARLRAAKHGTIIGRAARLPSISASGSASGSRFGNGPDLPAETNENYRLSLNAAWEIDLWGRLRDLDKASYDDYNAAIADFRGARLSLAANTAKAWFNLITAQQTVNLSLETLASFAANLRITERNYRAGDETASPLDVQFSRNNVAQAERALISTQLSRDDAARQLEILLGRYPSAELGAKDKSRNEDQLELARAFPDLPKDVPSGLPSELLMRRPDLVAFAAEVRASASRADASRKNLLPSIRLNGGGSTSSDSLNQMLTDPDYIVWSIASSLTQTVFQGGALSAQARLALERNEISIRNLAEAALQAFREVESALATERSLAAQEAFLDTELKQATLAEQQSARDYSEGIVGILEILEAQRRAVNARRSMISLHNQRLQNRIDLHLALGGDFGTAVPGN
jgi:multidrug efflux system outer membrane protein